MRKLLLILLTSIIMLNLVAAFDATRTITGNSVTIEIDTTDTTGYILDEVLPSGVTPSNIGQGGVYTESVKTIRWTKFDNSVTTLTYNYSGSGTVSGTITAGDPASQKTIGGDTALDYSTPQIKINEFVSDPNGAGDEWIEMYNPTGASVDLTGWTIEDGTGNANALDGLTISALGYLVLEKNAGDFTFSLNNGGDIIILKKGIEEIDKVSYGTWDDGNAADNAPAAYNGDSAGRLPNGADTDTDNADFSVFDSPTKQAVNQENGGTEDDLMVNYIRGKITMEGADAAAGTQYKVEILTGANAGYEHLGDVDQNIPTGLQGEGYYDTLDNIAFSTGESFRVSLEAGGYDCSVEGVFENGGNGNFNTGDGLVNLICTLPNNPPILDFIGNKQVNELGLLEFLVSATDTDVGDILNFFANNLPSGATFINQLFSWIPDADDFGTYDVEFVVDDGNGQDSETITITVNDVNHPPVLEHIEDQIIEEDTQGTFGVNAQDPDNTPLTYEIIDEDADEVDCEFNGNIITLIPAENYSGDASCEVQVSDGGLSDSQVFNIEVTPVNDLPVFIGNLQDITMEEDTLLENYIDLTNLLSSGYFFDPDSELEFNVEGNLNIDIIIENGLVSISPEADWWGSRNIVFWANEIGEPGNGAYSNTIAITVTDENEPPELSLNCEANILEDTAYTCGLSASDFEGDEFTFAITEENSLNCNIEDSTLNYISYLNYNGGASCLIRVSDAYSYNEYLLGVQVGGVNDAPVISSYNPGDNPKIFENTDELFSIAAFDVDSSINTSWFLDDIDLNITENSYLFNKDKGNYEVKAEITDGEYLVSQTWNVFVGDTSDFTCEEVAGYLCGKNEFCRKENVLGVKDTNSCCSVPCSPKFGEIDRCEEISDKIEVSIKDPDKGDEFKIGEKINAKLKIENNAGEDLDFDVEIHLYDTTEDDSIEDYEKSVDINENDKEEIETEFEVPEDLDEGNKYAIFIKVIEEDEKYCSEAYIPIDIGREKENVVIEEFRIEPESAVCGDYVDLEIKIKNAGSDRQDVYLTIENSELDIYEKGQEFELEKYNGDDEAVEYFSIKIPEDAPAGNYAIKATAVFEDNYSEEAELIIKECKKTEQKEGEIKQIFLQGSKKEAKIKEVEEQDKSKVILVIALLVTMLILTAIILIIFWMAL